MTGDECVCFLCCCFLSTTRFELATAMLNNFTALLDVVLQALPQTFCRFFLGSSRFVAFCFLWVGGVPLAAFCPPGFPFWVVRGWGFLPSLALLHLSL